MESATFGRGAGHVHSKVRVRARCVARSAQFELKLNLPPDSSWCFDLHLNSDLGPGAAEYLQKLTSYDLTKLVFGSSAYMDVAGVECHVARGGYTGEDGFEVCLLTVITHPPNHHSRPRCHITFVYFWSIRLAFRLRTPCRLPRSLLKSLSSLLA